MEIGRVTMVRIRRPAPDADVNELLQWFGASIGLFGQRDRDRSCFRLFIELIRSSREGKGLSSDELAYKLHLSRGTVVHHLSTLLDAGMVLHTGSTYMLRAHTLTSLTDDIRRDVERNFAELREIAEAIDQGLR